MLSPEEQQTFRENQRLLLQKESASAAAYVTLETQKMGVNNMTASFNQDELKILEHQYKQIQLGETQTQDSESEMSVTPHRKGDTF